MLSFPRRRRGKDNRQLYSIPDITSFILVYQRDDHIIIILYHIPPIRTSKKRTIHITFQLKIYFVNIFILTRKKCNF